MRAAVGVGDEDVYVTTGGLATAVGATGHNLQPGTDGECHLLHLLGGWGLQRKHLQVSLIYCNVDRSQHQGSMDGYTWRAPDCYTMRGIRDGSFFVKS